MKKQYRLAYAGIDSETFALLCSQPQFQLVATARWVAVFRATPNPVNWLFQIAYHLREKDSHRWLETLVASLFKSLAFCATGHWKRHRSCLRLLTEQRIALLDFSERTQTAQILKSTAVDLLVLSVWDVLPTEIIEAANFGTINVHPSKLPQYRGSLPTLWTLKNNDAETSVTYFSAGSSVDAGRILGQHLVKISQRETWLSLEEKIQAVVSQTLTVTIDDFLSGKTNEVQQDDAAVSWTGKYEDYRLISPAQERAKDVFNKINYYPHWDPGTYCWVETAGRKIIFKTCRFFDNHPSKTILSSLEDSLHVYGLRCRLQCSDGYVSSVLFMDHPVGDSIHLISRHSHRRLGELALGHTVNWLTVQGFDYILYPFVIWKLGPLLGGGIMALASLVICLLTLWFYDWSKRDWLGIEAIKELQEPGEAKGLRKLFARALKAGNIPAFLALSIYTDPFITTAYMRRGAFTAMTRRDWEIFPRELVDRQWRVDSRPERRHLGGAWGVGAVLVRRVQSKTEGCGRNGFLPTPLPGCVWFVRPAAPLPLHNQLCSNGPIRFRYSFTRLWR
ncbi:MAG: formyltransferase family protein [Terrimicrobiaceae bacterium]